MKKRIALLFSCIVLFSCSSPIPYQALLDAPDAKGYIINEISERKIIFISENHITENPIFFLSDNLQDFYNAGVRYLFLEGYLKALPGSDDYQIGCFFPWTSAGGKYEWLELSQAVMNLNSQLPETDRLKILTPEEGLDSPLENGKTHEELGAPSPDSPDWMQYMLTQRDEYAFKRIAETMNAALPDDKAIIFYGGGHGQKKPVVNASYNNSAPFTWKTFSYYLSEKYGDKFASFSYLSSSDFKYTQDSEKKWRRLDNVQKIVVWNEVKKYMHKSYARRFSMYDACIVESGAIYGICYQYMPTTDNLAYMFNSLKEYESKIDVISNEYNYLHFQDMGQYLLYIYYLKLYFGDSFNYNFWNTNQSLEVALDELDTAVFNQPNIIADKVLVKKDISVLREYHRLMITSGIEDFLNGAKVRLPYIIKQMKEAVSIFPEDLWSLYWLAYMETEHGDYKDAAAHWEYIISQPLSTCMETLPKMYERLAKCYQKMGEAAKSKSCLAKAGSLVNEHGLKVDSYIDIK